MNGAFDFFVGWLDILWNGWMIRLLTDGGFAGVSVENLTKMCIFSKLIYLAEDLLSGHWTVLWRLSGYNSIIPNT